MLKPLTVWITKNCGKFFKRWKYQTTFPASWETCMQVKKQELEPDMEQWTSSKLGKEYVKAVYCLPCLFNLYAENIMRNASLMKHNLESKSPGEILTTSDDTTLTAESEEELKSLLMKWKEEREKAGLKFNIQATKIMGYTPITSWQIDVETVETVTDFILGGSKITAYGDCSHEIKRHLLLGRKIMANLDSILKSKDMTLPTKVHLVKGLVFSSSHVWMWELDYKESWAPKNWCFGTVVLEKTLKSPLDCKEIQPVHPKGNQSWVFIGRMDADAETPILWPPDMKNWLTGKDPELGKTEGRRRRGWHHWHNGHESE